MVLNLQSRSFNADQAGSVKVTQKKGPEFRLMVGEKNRQKENKRK